MITLQSPAVSGWLIYVYAGIGALLLWAKLSREKRRVFGLTELIDMLNLSEKLAKVVELTIFIILGSFLSVGLVDPTNAPQAFAAGVGWTGLVSTNGQPRRRQNG